jgi:hypothetical protein
LVRSRRAKRKLLGQRAFGWAQRCEHSSSTGSWNRGRRGAKRAGRLGRRGLGTGARAVFDLAIEFEVLD